MKKRVVLQAGDTWEFQSNNGIIERQIKSVASGIVSYLRSDGTLHRCSRATFVAWTKGAEVTISSNWPAHKGVRQC